MNVLLYGHDSEKLRPLVEKHAGLRLVAKNPETVVCFGGDGTLRVAYEEVARDSVLAARVGSVVYDYHLSGNERRLHVGGGIGPAATADALWTDVQALVARNASLRAIGGAR